MKRSLSVLSFVMLVLSSAGLPATASACSLVMDPTGTPPPPPPRDDTGAFLVGAGGCSDNRAEATYTLGSGIAMMVAGTWHMIHGIWSVASPNDVPDVAPTAWFDEHGGSVGLVGRF